MGAGSTDHASTRSTWWLSAGGYTAISPDGDLATMTLSSPSIASACSTTHVSAASSRHAEAASEGEVVCAWPRPSYPPRAAFTKQRPPRDASACSSSASLVATANGPTGKPAFERKDFWAARSWIRESAALDGRTGTSRRARSRQASAIFSISSVTTSLPAASRAAASTSSKAATMCSSTEKRAAQPGSGSTTRDR